MYFVQVRRQKYAKKLSPDCISLHGVLGNACKQWDRDKKGGSHAIYIGNITHDGRKHGSATYGHYQERSALLGVGSQAPDGQRKYGREHDRNKKEDTIKCNERSPSQF